MIKHDGTLNALKRMCEEDQNGFSNDILALIDYKCKTTRAEAIKEFAEKCARRFPSFVSIFNKIAKEMGVEL